MSQDFVLPDLGEGITEAQVVRLLISQGQHIEQDQAMMEVETDKAAVEIPSPYEGKAEVVHVAEGQTIKVGDVMVTFSNGGAGSVAAPPKQAQAKQKTNDVSKAPASPPPVADPKPRSSKTVPASPAVRKFARELGIDLASVAGSGPGGRVRREDVESAAAAGSAPPSTAPVTYSAPAPVATPVPAERPGTPGTDSWGPIRTHPLTQIRKTIANQMSRSVSTIPHVTHCDDADITDLDRLRRQAREAEPHLKLTLMPFVIKAVAKALRAFPGMNCTFDADNNRIIYKDYVSIGIAVDTERGLVVPALRNVDQLSVGRITDELLSIADKARRSAFAVEELRGGTFTITNVGSAGGRYSTPIINFPEAAILCTGRSRMEAVVVGGEVVPRLIFPLSLSFDHRAIDGAAAAVFCREIIASLENPARMML